MWSSALLSLVVATAAASESRIIVLDTKSELPEVDKGSKPDLPTQKKPRAPSELR